MKKKNIALPMGNLIRATAQAVMNAKHHAVDDQQEGNMAGVAATAMGIMVIDAVVNGPGITNKKKKSNIKIITA